MWIRAFVLVFASALLGFAVNAARPAGVAIAAWRPPTSCSGGEAPVLLQPAQAASLCGAPGVVVADVRSPDAFAQGHVAGAIHLPCQASVPVELRRIEGAQKVLVYGESTDDAQRVAATLQQRGLHVEVIAGGFPAWSNAGLACASGPCDDCKVRP